jgi:hypothetical protein
MTPTASILAKATEQKTVEDGLCRRLMVRRLTALDTLRLFKAAGPVLSQNQAWLGVASLALSVLSIDDLPIPTPTSEAQIEAIVVRLGDEGLVAVADAFGSDEAANHSAVSESAGNSLGTRN